MTNEASQLVFFMGQLEDLAPVDQETLGLLLINRFITLSEEAFPTGLPTAGTPYATVRQAFLALWEDQSEDTLRQLVPSTASQRPVSGGHLRPGPGALLGYFVADSLHRGLIRSLERGPAPPWVHQIWDGMTGMLRRTPMPRDWSINPTFLELTPEWNGALLLEFEQERADLAALAAGASRDPSLLEAGTGTARRIAAIARDEPRRS